MIPIVGVTVSTILFGLMLWVWRYAWANNKTYNARTKMIDMASDSKSWKAYNQVTYQEHFINLMLGRNVKNLYINNGWDLDFPENM